MRRSAKYFMAAAIVVCGFNLGAVESASAGRGLRIFRGRVFQSARTQSNRQTYSPAGNTYRSNSSRPRISAPNNWPGTIGSQPPRYEFFQSINGYWK